MIGIKKKQSFLLKNALLVDFGLPLSHTVDLPLIYAQVQTLTSLGVQQVVFTTEPISFEESISFELEGNSIEGLLAIDGINVSIMPTYWLDGAVEDFIQQNALTVHAGKYVLLALKEQSVRELKAPLFEIRARGYEPVIIHYQPREFAKWKLPALEYLGDLGCLFQLNIMTLAGAYGQKAKHQAESLLNKGLIQFFTTGINNETDIGQIETLMMSTNMVSILEHAILRHTTSLSKFSDF